MDQLGGVDFDKGCYVGQEVVSRMQHRGTARTRVVPVGYADGAAAPGAARSAPAGRASASSAATRPAAASRCSASTASPTRSRQGFCADGRPGVGRPATFAWPRPRMQRGLSRPFALARHRRRPPARHDGVIRRSR